MNRYFARSNQSLLVHAEIGLGGATITNGELRNIVVVSGVSGVSGASGVSGDGESSVRP